jgi:AraC family transcriptional regulator
MPFAIKNAIFLLLMNLTVAKTNLFGKSLQKQKVSAFTLSERFYSPFFSTPRHAHENALFCLVLKGSYTETYGRKRIDCLPATMLFHAGEFPHEEHYHRHGGHSFIVEIEKSWLDNIREQIDFPTFSIDFRIGPLPPLGARLYQEFGRLDGLSPMIVEGLMLEIAGQTARRTFNSKDQTPAWLKKAEDLLQQRYSEQISLSEIAAFVQVHPIHLAQSFRKFRGTTVGNYLREIRLERARRELIETTKTLAEVSLNNGFCDQSHLSRLFKQKFGATPHAYRQSFR